MNKRIKSVIVAVLAVMLSVSMLAACGGPVKFDPEHPELTFKMPQYADDQEMLIGGFCSPAVRLSGNARTPDQAAFTDIAELGITHLFPDMFQCDFGEAPEQGMIFLDRADAEGLKVFVHDTALGGRTYADHNLKADKWDSSWAHIYTEHSAFAGVHFVDEPSGSELSIVAAKQDLWRREFNDKMFMVNLFPGYVGTPKLGGAFRSYINNYLTTTQPDLLSFDYYALLQDETLRATYFQEMGIIKQAAKNAGIPAHAYILSAGHEGYKRDLTTADLRWQIAVTMAFGYETFSHYPAGAIYAGYDEIITVTGERTDLWHSIQTVNNEVKSWDNVYLNFNWNGITPIAGSHGNTNVMLGAIQDGLIAVSDLDGIKSISATQDLLCGSFIDLSGNSGFMLTNAANPNDDSAASVSVEFDKKYKAVLVYEKGIEKIYALDGGKVNIALETGEGKFIIPLKLK